MGAIGMQRMSRVAMLVAIGAIAIPAVTNPVVAQEVERPTVSEAFNNTLYSNEPDSLNRSGFLSSVSSFLGLPGFPENQIRRDARAINALYEDVLEQQVASDPTIRTPDLPNPFVGSYLTTGLSISEEPIPPAPPSVILQQPNVVAPVPTAPTAPARPVPALW
ncbi:MAG TPA: hypothetical protein V6D10_21690 [Trichocoleus sp.]